MKVFALPPVSWRRIGLAVVASILLHLSLVAVGLLFPGFEPRVFIQRGEPLFVELPTLEEEPAPRGNPALPLEPRAPRPAAPAPKPRRPAPKPVPKAKPAPKAEIARPAPKAPFIPPEPSPEPAAPKLARALPEPVPPEPVAPPEPPETTGPEPVASPAPSAPEPEPESPPVTRPQVALSKPPAELPPRPGRDRPGGGGGLLGGRGGIEGEPIPLDTTDPRYTDYFEIIRRQIQAKWIYPRSAGARGIGGQLRIDFAIRKDGWLLFADLQRSSGVGILDLYALNAVKLAQPFPPVPNSVARGPLNIAGIFTYQVVDAGLLNKYLR